MMIRNQSLFAIIFVALLLACEVHEVHENDRVRTGAEMLIENHLAELVGKRVGLVMNPTAIINDTHVLDTLLMHGVNITSLFAPEHGFRGEAGAGEIIEDGIDQATGLPVFSLYGQTRSPTAEMLRLVDIILFDMQDVGARFYTYNSTLGLVIQEAARQQIPVWVLDRPNPAGGDYVSGWALEEEHKSFVGMYPIPIAHGMTLGELALMITGERWLDFQNEPDLKIISMNGWHRSMKWPDTGLRWYPPSPNLPTFEHAFAYLGTCLVEGTNLSEGRGTDDPFLLLGSPDTNISNEDLELLNSFPGISIERVSFIPESIPGKAISPKHEGAQCSGLRLRIIDFDAYDPVVSGLKILRVLTHRTENVEFKPFLHRLAGTKMVDHFLNSDIHETAIEFGLLDFKNARKGYLIYD
ncbi:MAG: exo-beta-N-acetylmuramidase NamZ domain-containing protein [Balneolaceae bacterium]